MLLNAVDLLSVLGAFVLKLGAFKIACLMRKAEGGLPRA